MSHNADGWLCEVLLCCPCHATAVPALCDCSLSPAPCADGMCIDVQALDRDLEDAEEQYGTALRGHLQVVDSLQDLQYARMKTMQEQFQANLKVGCCPLASAPACPAAYTDLPALRGSTAAATCIMTTSARTCLQERSSQCEEHVLAVLLVACNLRATCNEEGIMT